MCEPAIKYSQTKPYSCKVIFYNYFVVQPLPIAFAIFNSHNLFSLFLVRSLSLLCFRWFVFVFVYLFHCTAAVSQLSSHSWKFLILVFCLCANIQAHTRTESSLLLYSSFYSLLLDSGRWTITLCMCLYACTDWAVNVLSFAQ